MQFPNIIDKMPKAKMTQFPDNAKFASRNLTNKLSMDLINNIK